MKRVLGFFLFALCILTQPITVQANSKSYIIPQEVDGVPQEIKEIAEIVGNEFNICPELLEAMAYQESRFDADAKNGSCKGLMQVNTGVHKDRFDSAGWSASEWDDAYKNMYVAADYLAELFADNEDVALVLYLYNGDSANVRRYKESGYLSYYVRTILEKSEELERLHGK